MTWIVTRIRTMVDYRGAWDTVYFQNSRASSGTLAIERMDGIRILLQKRGFEKNPSKKKMYYLFVVEIYHCFWGQYSAISRS